MYIHIYTNMFYGYVYVYIHTCKYMYIYIYACALSRGGGVDDLHARNQTRDQAALFVPVSQLPPSPLTCRERDLQSASRSEAGPTNLLRGQRMRPRAACAQDRDPVIERESALLTTYWPVIEMIWWTSHVP